MLRLLRSERRNTNAETAIIQWLGSELCQQTSKDIDSIAILEQKEKLQNEEYDGELEKKGKKDVESVVNNHKEFRVVGRPLSITDDREGWGRRSSDTGRQRDEVRRNQKAFNHCLVQLLPTIVHHTSSSESTSTAYILWQPQSTKSIACPPSSWTATQRFDVEYDLGKITRGFSRFTSPNGRFGYAGSIIPCRHEDSPKLMDAKTPTSSSRGGCSTWPKAFHLMLEDVLRDGEDMAVSLPYPALRKHFLHLSIHLDEVTEPRLVFINGAEDSNVLVAVDCKEDGEYLDEEGFEKDTNEIDDSLQGGARREPCLREGEYDGGSTSTTKPMTVLGFRDWSSAIFGDPLIATVFGNKPSPAFMNGYNHQKSCSSPTTSSKTSGHGTTPAEIRLLLYQAYHATVAIVKEFYHPKSDRTARELAARRRLNEVLLKLQNVEEQDVDGQRPEPVRRRPSGDVSPAKKLKSLEKEREQIERMMVREERDSFGRREVEVAE